MSSELAASYSTAADAAQTDGESTGGVIEKMLNFIPEGVWRTVSILAGACAGSAYKVRGL